MKIKEDIDCNELLQYGFYIPSKDDEDNEDYNISNSDYVLSFGHSRRGQFYYILIKNRNVYIYSSKPDGDGGKLLLPYVILTLILEEIIIV